MWRENGVLNASSPPVDKGNVAAIQRFSDQRMFQDSRQVSNICAHVVHVGVALKAPISLVAELWTTCSNSIIVILDLRSGRVRHVVFCVLEKRLATSLVWAEDRLSEHSAKSM